MNIKPPSSDGMNSSAWSNLDVNEERCGEERSCEERSCEERCLSDSDSIVKELDGGYNFIAGSL